MIFKIDFASLFLCRNPSFQVNCTQKSEALTSDLHRHWGAAALWQALRGPSAESTPPPLGETDGEGHTGLLLRRPGAAAAAAAGKVLTRSASASANVSA